ncbi:serine/threonine protein kinase [Emydomyces testavorans]|uniref:Serine/threonine protein kinase n=1 Tax=Emydomyces testavorans TaxID=2070801 RepID=A0AAF0DDI5_9EURO|nr:serine/threonine protein kinase [Emydomyces testavorans]
MADEVFKTESTETLKLCPGNERLTATDGSKPRPLRTSNSSQDDGTAEHRINQYLIKQEIGRGSFGAVHLAVDQYGQEYAVKEFSKSRLRKRAQSHVLRNLAGLRRPGTRAAGIGFNEPLHRNPSSHDLEEGGNSLYLIKQEIAIMKKLNHPNLVSLFEVLDDPTEDSLYMVMEMCKKGVIMKVGLGEETDPYDDESCRCWFRDLILGIEYLHAQGIVHRDIKPDNCLLTSDDVLKIVDFGVSEMFEKDSDMYTAKSAGSPAFLPPELCVVKHGDVSGRAADIWSMGVTLYCLRYGRIPFEKESIFELYEAIRNDEVNCPGESDDDFKDLMSRILEKDPKKRITMLELREHPWVTKRGMDTLLSVEENTSNFVEPPTEEEMNAAITRNMAHAITVVKAVQKFKRLIEPKSPRPMQSILGDDAEPHFVQPPLSINESHAYGLWHDQKSATREAYIPPGVSGAPCGPEPADTGELPIVVDVTKRHNSSACQSLNQPNCVSGRTSQCSISGLPTVGTPAPQASCTGTPSKGSFCEGTRGHARDPLEEEHPYLFIGPSRFSAPMAHNPTGDSESEPYLNMDTDPSTDLYSTPVVSESPSAADIDIYETAYRSEIERVRNRTRASHAPAPKVYLTRRVDGKKSSLAALLEQAKEEGTLQTPRASQNKVGEDRVALGSSQTRTSSALAAAISCLKAPTLSGRQEASQGSGLKEESKIQASTIRVQETLAPNAPAKPNLATATVTATVATAIETPLADSEESRSALRTLLSRIKDDS